MRILVTFALEQEFAPWRHLRSFRKTEVNGVSVLETRIGEACICVALTGMGVDNARRIARRLLEEHPDVCISSGFAGALKPFLRPGNIVAARLVCEAAGSRGVQCAPGLLEAAWSRGARRVSALVTVDQLVARAEVKRRLASRGDAVEMESFGVLSEAVAVGVRALAIRAISDAWDEALPLDFERAADNAGHLRTSKLLSQLLVRPHRVPALLRLGRASRHAAVMLSGFLDGFVGGLPFEESGRFVEPAFQVVGA